MDDRDAPEPSDDGESGLDVDAAWADIVAHWEPSAPGPSEAAVGTDRPDGPDVPDVPERHDGPAGGAVEPQLAAPPPMPPSTPAPSDPDRLRGLFEPAWDDPHQTPATWDDEGHFVPPDPPLPPVEPARRAAWGGVVGGPAVALLSLVLGLTLPGWVAVGLVMAFVGGFAYLVATMEPRSDDQWPGDGAVL